MEDWQHIRLSTAGQDDPPPELLERDRLPQKEVGLSFKVNPGAHAGAGQPAPSWVIAPSHYPQILCWAIIVKMWCSYCQQQLNTYFCNAIWMMTWMTKQMITDDHGQWQWWQWWRAVKYHMTSDEMVKISITVKPLIQGTPNHKTYVFHLVLQLSLPNLLKPGVKLRMKM